MAGKIKAGPLTLALGLVVLGAGMLAYNFGGISSPQNLWKFWPLLLIGLGFEFLVRRMLHRDDEVVFHIPSCLLIGVLILAGLTVTAFSDTNINKILEDTVFRNSVSHTRQWQSQPVSLAEGSQLRVENKNGALQIRPSADENLHVQAEITAYGHSEDRAKINAENSDVVIEKTNGTRIFTRFKGDSDSHNISVKLTVEIPAGLSTEVDCSNGRIEIRDLTGKLNVRTDNGEVNVLGLNGSLEVNTENGLITVSKVTGNVTANTRNGRIRVENPGGDVQARTQNGDIELSSNAPLTKNYILSSSHGSLNLRLPGDSDLTIEARTRNGSIEGMNDNFDSGPAQLKVDLLKLGGGKGGARLSTENGSIQVYVE
jgi:hypothetical protein